MQDKESVISTLRACILSNQGGVQLNALNRDYKSLVGSHIPFRDLGYSTLEHFVASAPNIYVTKANGEIIVNAQPTESSAHIAKLVNKQKSSTQKKRVPVPNFVSSGNRRQTNSQWKVPHLPPRKAQNSLSVTVGNTNNSSRHVTLSTKNKSQGDASRHRFEPPPRFEKSKKYPDMGPRSLKENMASLSLSDNDLRWKLQGYPMNSKQPVLQPTSKQKPATNSFDEYEQTMLNSKNNSIISPFAPKNAIAAGRAKSKEFNNYDNYKYVEYEMDVPPWERKSMGLASAALYSETYVNKLQNFSRSKNWPDPVYKIIPRCPKDERRKIFGCQVNVNVDQHFASYPDESYIAEEAQEFAAKKAYTKLIELEQKTLMNGMVTTDANLIHDRVTEIVKNYPQGMWSESVLSTYNTQYNETLPTDWLSIIRKYSHTLNLTAVCKGRVIIKPNSVSTLEETGQMLPAGIGAGDYFDSETPDILDIEYEQTSSEPEYEQTSPEPEYEQISPEPEIYIQLAEQRLPKEENWDVFVTHLASTNQIFLRLIGEDYSEKHDAVISEVELFYEYGHGTICPSDKIELEAFYIGKLETDWYRICVIELVEDGKCWCQLIDHGELEIFDVSDIYIMESKFFHLQPQAVLCTLTGVYDSDDAELKNLICEMIVGKTLVARIDERDDENRTYSLTLFDTSTTENLNLNETISDLADTLDRPPELPSEGFKEVYVSHVTKDGGLYVQMQSARYKSLMTLIEELDPNLIDSNRIISAAVLSADKRYLAKFCSDGKYYRAVITRAPSAHETKIDVMFIDYGNTELVSIRDISDLETISPQLYAIQPQAVFVILYNLQLGKKECDQLRELIPEEEPVILKILQGGGSGGSVPQVEVFKRSIPGDNSSQLISINNTISVKQEPSRSLQRRHSLRRPLDQKKEQQSLPPPTTVLQVTTVHKKLSPPEIPEVDKAYFDVYVTMAANPSNFIIQPLESLPLLVKMASEMKAFYTDEKNQQEELKVDDLVEGGLYAALVSDNDIPRVTLATIIDDCSVSVHSCDFGEYLVVPMGKLRYLPPQFTELPYQAIKAKLVGVQPIHGDWTAEDCVRFQEMVVDKQLVSIIKEKGPDIINNSDTVLGLMLVDTITDDDVVLHIELVKENRAILDPENHIEL